VPTEIKNIVVVDDNPLLVSVLVKIFEEQGHVVRTAVDGFAALALIRDQVPDILISDLNMPRMTGFELLSIVRRRFPMIAVVAMSGACSGTIVPSGVAADGFYAKGLCSVVGLFDILSTIEDEAIRQSRRSAAPIWIPGTPIDRGDLATLSIACPECLRTFSYCHKDAECLQEERCCPHCLHSVKLAIVTSPERMVSRCRARGARSVTLPICASEV
jgi:CheY-like chemotaxis protein